jgi:hypothetical protein
MYMVKRHACLNYFPCHFGTPSLLAGVRRAHGLILEPGRDGAEEATYST